MTELSVPLLNRLVDAMLEHADPKADQNIWNLARAAEEVMREVKSEQLVAAYGGPLARTEISSPTGRMQMASIPLTQVARDYSRTKIEQGPDYAAALGEVERRLMLKAPQYSGATTADKVDALAQDYQAMGLLLEETKLENNQLTKKLAVLEEVISQVREVLDPDNQFENESLVVLARERMSQRAARKQELERLQQRIGTEIEANSAEMLRRVLGAQEHETLGAAAKRVAQSANSGWEAYTRLNDLQNNQFHQLNSKIRELVCAVDESESDDHYIPGQPTVDAVRRLVLAFFELSKEFEKDKVHVELSPESAYREMILRRVQDSWVGNELKSLPGESK